MNRGPEVVMIKLLSLMVLAGTPCSAVTVAKPVILPGASGSAAASAVAGPVFARSSQNQVPGVTGVLPVLAQPMAARLSVKPGASPALAKAIKPQAVPKVTGDADILVTNAAAKNNADDIGRGLLAGLPHAQDAGAGPVSALSAKAPAEFSRAPSWIDTSELKFDILTKSGSNATAVLRYKKFLGAQFEMTVYAYPGAASISFKQYKSNPMSDPENFLNASLETAASRAEAAKILRDVQRRHPVEGKDKATLDAILMFLATLVHQR